MAQLFISWRCVDVIQDANSAEASFDDPSSTPVIGRLGILIEPASNSSATCLQNSHKTHTQ
jgi:hypothetical protein